MALDIHIFAREAFLSMPGIHRYLPLREVPFVTVTLFPFILQVLLEATTFPATTQAAPDRGRWRVVLYLTDF